VGKGGTGKTTLSGLLVKHLLTKGSTPVLAIDADPAQSFGRVLGAEAPETLGGIREEILGPQSLVPAGMAKKSYLDLRVQSSIVECAGFDLLTMGRPEGPGCYCYVNNLLRESLDALADSYPWVVIDCEAGMEHLSRRTTKDVDYLFVVCNGSAASIETATRILDLIEELRTSAAHRILVLNNLSSTADGVAESLLARIDTSRFETAGVVPHDPEIEAFERSARPFAELPVDTPAYLALERILGELSE
jgi:CO dehydrogenase maturation factor